MILFPKEPRKKVGRERTRSLGDTLVPRHDEIKPFKPEFEKQILDALRTESNRRTIVAVGEEKK